MAKAIICDRCGKVFKDTDEHYLVKYGEVSSICDGMRSVNTPVYDLCKNCHDDLIYFMVGFATESVDG